MSKIAELWTFDPENVSEYMILMDYRMMIHYKKIGYQNVTMSMIESDVDAYLNTVPYPKEELKLMTRRVAIRTYHGLVRSKERLPESIFNDETQQITDKVMQWGIDKRNSWRHKDKD